MKLVLLQSNYMPWKGYFDMIAMADVMVFHDTVQYTKQDWRNRNIIKTHHGLRWISVPCGNQGQKTIDQVRLVDGWQIKHRNQIYEAYHKAPCYDFIEPFVKELYGSSWRYLSCVNQWSIGKICRMLQISTPLLNSSELSITGRNWQRVLNICKDIGATTYISGSAGKNYINEQAFRDAGVEIHWMDYNGYPEYPQLHGQFKHQVSIIDLLANTGINANKFMKYEKFL